MASNAITDDQLRRRFPHRIQDSQDYGRCPACAGDGKCSEGTHKLYDIPSLGTTVYRCEACDGTGERTVEVVR